MILKHITPISPLYIVNAYQIYCYDFQAL